jgi:hypothetical protein
MSKPLITAVLASLGAVLACSNGKDFGLPPDTLLATPNEDALSDSVPLAPCLLVSDIDIKEEPAVAKPGYLQSVIDPVFGTKITRITGNVGDQVPLVGGSWQSVAVHNYSKDAAWNADQSLIFIKRHLGGPNPLFLNGETYEVLFSANGPGETRWHPQDPETMIFVGGDCRVGHWTPRTSITTVSNDFSVRNTDNRAVAFAYDLSTKQKFNDIDLLASGMASVDWISISPSGQYIVANGTVVGEGADRTLIFDLDGKRVGPVWDGYGQPSHYDLAIDTNGNEIGVGVSQSTMAGSVIARSLLNGSWLPLSTGGFPSHISTRNSRLPGWAFASNGYNGPDYPPYRDELLAVHLDGQRPQVYRLGHLHTRGSTDYEAEPHAVPSPDGRRVLFASAWDEGNLPVSTYVLDIRDVCPSGLPHQ